MKVIGLDCNSKSIAYSELDNGVLKDYGLLSFSTDDRNKRVKDAYRQAAKLFENKSPDAVAIEDAVFVQNQQSLITLSYYFGAIIAASPVKVYSVRPLEWQSNIGNKVLNAGQKNLIKIASPGKSETWYKNKYRESRKDFTRQWVKTNFGVEIESDDICDSVGIGWWLHTNGS